MLIATILRKLLHATRTGTALAIAIGATMGVATAQTTDFYQGKTFQILVGFPSGGGYDLFARALGAFLSNHIPGNPKVIVENMAGAGSLRLATYLQNAAPRDGLTIGTMDNALQIASLIRPDSVTFDGSKLNWIGSIASDVEVCSTWHTLGASRLEDLLTKQAIFGATGPDDARYESIAVLKNVSGADVKLVTGYPGSSDIYIAVENGEINAVCDGEKTIKAAKPDWIADKKINMLVQMASERSREIPDVPAVTEFAKSAPEKDALDLLFSASRAARPFGAPPGVPAERVQLLRRAFDDTMKDPAFLDYARKMHFDIDPLTGEEMDASLKRYYSYPTSVLSLAHKLID